jgi:hypothetical protein
MYDILTTRKQPQEGTMDPQVIKAKFTDLLARIQEDSGFPPVPITGTTCPLDDLEGFDSLIWPIATRLLVKELGMEISRKKNIFVTKGKRLTVDEIVDVVHQIAANPGG